jgi:hypothetical protein
MWQPAEDGVQRHRPHSSWLPQQHRAIIGEPCDDLSIARSGSSASQWSSEKLSDSTSCIAATDTTALSSMPVETLHPMAANNRRDAAHRCR